MTRKISCILFLALLAFSFCQKKATAPAQAKPSEKNQAATRIPAEAETGTSFATQAAAVASETSLKIKTAVLIPQAPTVGDEVSVEAKLKDPAPPEVDFQYQWFVNGREVSAAVNQKLGKGLFKKNDWLYCMVMAVSSTAKSPLFKSEIIRVLNSLPAFDLAPVPAFPVPGTFNYKIVASDPDQDALNFALISPLDRGIALDAETGVLTWKIDSELLKKLGKTVEIKFAVSDNDGGPATGSITLNFSSSKQTR